MAAPVAGGLPARDRASGPILPQTRQQANAHLVDISDLRRALFAVDLLYRLQAPRRRDRMERTPSGGYPAAWRDGGMARPHLRLDLFTGERALQSGRRTTSGDVAGPLRGTVQLR